VLEAGKFLFDVQLLGLGEDGHTASLIPGEAVLDEREHWVAEVSHGRPEARITLTYPALESSRHTAFLIAGAGKRDMLKSVRARSLDVPAARLRPQGDLTFLIDRAAAGNGV
jgi:6-phosphogluconolactonase